MQTTRPPTSWPNNRHKETNHDYSNLVQSWNYLKEQNTMFWLQISLTFYTIGEDLRSQGQTGYQNLTWRPKHQTLKPTIHGQRKTPKTLNEIICIVNQSSILRPKAKELNVITDENWNLHSLFLSLCLSGTYIIGTSENIWDILHRLSSYWSCMVHNSQLSLKIKLIVEIWYMNPFSSFNRSNIFIIINQDMVDVLVYFPISILNF